MELRVSKKVKSHNVIPIPPKVISHPRKRKLPVFKGKIISSEPIVFEGEVLFEEDSDAFREDSSSHNDKILNDLIKTLKEWPNIKVLIKGNTSQDWSGIEAANNVNLNSPVGGGNQPVRINTIRKLQLGRANAIIKFLFSNGVKIDNLTSGNGKIRFRGYKGRITTFEITK